MSLTTKDGARGAAKTAANPALKKIWITAGVVVVLTLLVLAARWWRGTAAGEQFITAYPGHSALPEHAPTGIPAWLGWQHFLNAFFMVLIIRSGWLIRTTARPKAYWTRNNTGLFKTKTKPKKISLEIWLHLSLDVLWIVNGVVFMVLLFATGAWMRIVPTSWDIVPNAFSAGVQYLSLDWPSENGWLNYNALQVLAYFAIVFLAAPVSAITGLRMSPAWPAKLDKALPMEAARKVHFPAMLFFVGFLVMHVMLVLLTGARANLNHMFAARSDDGWMGVILFAVAVAATAGAWFACKPVVIRALAGMSGKISK